MNGEIQCWTCVYGENRIDITCNNGMVAKLKHKPDRYDCEWYEEQTDDYVADVDKVARTW